MRSGLVLLLLLTACTAQAATTPTPSPVPTPTVAPTPAYPTPEPFTSKHFSVSVIVIAVADDPAPERIAAYLRDNLAEAWNIATAQRSTLTITPAEGDVILVVDSSKNGRQPGWGFDMGDVRIIAMHELDGPMTFYVKTAVHELGHALGCCSGPGSDGTGHVANCPPTSVLFPEGSAIMCQYGGGATTFNDYEMSAMGLE